MPLGMPDQVLQALHLHQPADAPLLGEAQVVVDDVLIIGHCLCAHKQDTGEVWSLPPHNHGQPARLRLGQQVIADKMHTGRHERKGTSSCMRCKSIEHLRGRGAGLVARDNVLE